LNLYSLAWPKIEYFDFPLLIFKLSACLQGRYYFISFQLGVWIGNPNEGILQVIEYDKWPSVCFYCGNIGHIKMYACPSYKHFLFKKKGDSNMSVLSQKGRMAPQISKRLLWILKMITCTVHGLEFRGETPLKK